MPYKRTSAAFAGVKAGSTRPRNGANRRFVWSSEYVLIGKPRVLRVFSTDRNSDAQLPFILDDGHLIRTVKTMQEDYPYLPASPPFDDDCHPLGFPIN